MDNESLAPLIKFIGEKFEKVDQRFDVMEAKIADTRRHMGVLVEAVRDDVRQVAEGLAGTNQCLDRVEHRLDGVDQRLDRFEQRAETEFAETRAAIRFSYVQIERRIEELESNYASLNKRLARLESK
jgi:chromosome segregation ATPase